jgi:hypothetical protein
VNSALLGTAAAVPAGLPGKRVAVLIAREKSHRGATLGLQARFQGLTRYLRQDLVGVEVGIGDRLGDVRLDPGGPLGATAELGHQLFDVRVTDYRFDTPRANAVWSSSA